MELAGGSPSQRKFPRLRSVSAASAKSNFRQASGARSKESNFCSKQWCNFLLRDPLVTAMFCPMETGEYAGYVTPLNSFSSSWFPFSVCSSSWIFIELHW